jgi:hypothetical protein
LPYSQSINNVTSAWQDSCSIYRRTHKEIDMNTIAIVEEWNQFQDQGSIDWSGFTAHQPVESAHRRIGLCEEYEYRHERRAGAGDRRFGFPGSSVAPEDDDPE